jgi:arsenate reductase
MMNVLFLCTGNSARSIIAEGLLNNLPTVRGRLRAFSAGSHPKGEVNPFALEVLRENEIPVEGFRSKSWDEFAVEDAPPMHFVITVCDQAAAETCPVWPGHPVSAHWGVADPAAVEGSDDEKRRAFRAALIALGRRIESFVSLPVESLDPSTLQ